MVSEELRFTDSYPSIIRCIAIFEKAWDQIDEDARLRAENKMIKLIPQATLNRDGGTNAAGTYASRFTSIINKSSLREKISYAIYESLSSHEEDKQRFIVHHYGEYIESFEDRSVHQSLLVILKDGLLQGNSVIFHYVKNYLSRDKEPLLQKEIEKYKILDDDLPF